MASDHIWSIFFLDVEIAKSASGQFDKSNDSTILAEHKNIWAKLKKSPTVKGKLHFKIN